MRTITVYQMRGTKRVDLQSDATTRGQLRQLFKDNDITFDPESMVMVEGENTTTLDLDSSVLPKGDFFMTIFPKRTKAGGQEERSRLYSRIREFIERDGKAAVSTYLNNRNYTNIPTAELQSLVDGYVQKNQATTRPQANKAVKTEDVFDAFRALAASAGLNADAIELMVSILKDAKNGIPAEHQEWIDKVCREHPNVKC